MLSYIGPGGALSAIGSLLALLAATVLALLGFVWYPIKRLLRALGRGKATSATTNAALENTAAASSTPMVSSAATVSKVER
jgi:hypothetical protein